MIDGGEDASGLFPLVVLATCLVSCTSDGPVRTHAQAVRDSVPAVTTRAVIGPAGGTLRLPDGATIVVPPGALTRRVEMSVREILPPSQGGPPPGLAVVGKWYAFEPRSVEFGRPAKISLPYDPRRLPSSAAEGAIGIFAWSPRGDFDLIASATGDPLRESSGQDIDVAAKTVSVLVSFASIFTIAVPIGAPRP